MWSDKIEKSDHAPFDSVEEKSKKSQSFETFVRNVFLKLTFANSTIRIQQANAVFKEFLELWDE